GVLAALWGASYLFIEVGLDGGLDPTLIVFLRALLGALVLAPVALSRRAFAPLRGRIGWVVVLALLNVILPFMLIAVGQQHVSSSLAGILVASSTIFTALLAFGFDASDRVSGWGLGGIFVGIVGVALLFGV